MQQADRTTDAPLPTAPSTSLLKAVRRLLRPVVGLMIRNGVTFPAIADLLRTLFVEVAATEVLFDPKSRTDSRISLLTGVHRKEIRRLREDGKAAEAVPEIVTVSSQIIARWVGTPDYVDASGRPRTLPRAPRGDGTVSFEGLVGSVTTDVRPRAFLDNWLDLGLVTIDADDYVHLNTSAFIPRASGEEQLFYFGRNLHDHVRASVANIGAGDAPRFLDRSVHYDRLGPDAARRLEEFARECAMQALIAVNRKALELIEAGGSDPAEPGTSRRVNFGTYVFAEDEERNLGAAP